MSVGRQLPTLLRNPFLSPDGEWVGFGNGSNDSLNKVSVQGGPIVPICTECATIPLGASWGDDDTIVFGTDGSGRSDRPSGLWRVSANDGHVEELTTPESPLVNHAWPDMLPGGRGVLYTTVVGRFIETAQIAVVDLATSEQTILIPSGSFARYSPTGHILYVLDGSLWAVGFDVDHLRLTNPNPVRLLDGIDTRPYGANFDLANDGTFVYVPGPDTSAPPERTLSWIARDGTETPLAYPAAQYTGPRLSPDGTRIAVSIEDPANTDIWILDVDRGTQALLTTNTGPDTSPVWTPDGDRVVFTSERDGGVGLYWKTVDEAGTVEHLVDIEGATAIRAYDWSEDGTSLVFEYTRPDTLADIGLLRLEDPPTWQPLIETATNERAPVISPDGRWIAYHSDETVNQQVYVERFAGRGDRQVMSTGTALQPIWPHDDELLFRLRDASIFMTVHVSPGAPLRSDDAESLLDFESELSGPLWLHDGFREYDYSPSADRFIMLKSTRAARDRDAAPSGIVVVQNWRDELLRLVPID